MENNELSKELSEIHRLSDGFIYVYDRLNREIHNCKITRCDNNIWAYFKFNNMDCSYWLLGSNVSSLYVPNKYNNYMYLVSDDLASLKEIKDSDTEIFSVINRKLREDFENIIYGRKKVID